MFEAESPPLGTWSAQRCLGGRSLAYALSLAKRLGVALSPSFQPSFPVDRIKPRNLLIGELRIQMQLLPARLPSSSNSRLGQMSNKAESRRKCGLTDNTYTRVGSPSANLTSLPVRDSGMHVQCTLRIGCIGANCTLEKSPKAVLVFCLFLLWS